MRWHVALSAVAWAAGGHDVARRVRSAARQRQNMVQRGRLEIEGGSAVDTPAAAITERRAFEGALVRGASAGSGVPRANCEEPRERDAMKVPLDEAMMRHLCSGIGNRESGIWTDRRDSIFGIADSDVVRRGRSDLGGGGS
jgi:hypothetical protein